MGKNIFLDEEDVDRPVVGKLEIIG